MPVQWLPGSLTVANSYIYEGILIDAGIPPFAVTPYRGIIHTIVLTHCHYDHTAHAGEIARMCNAEIAIHRLDGEALRDDFRSVAMHFGGRAPAVRPDRILEDGETIGPLTVIHTPGHTPGGICLYEEHREILFSGDTVFTEGSFGRYDLPGGDLATLKRSIKRLTALRVEELYPGHEFPVQKDGGKHIAAACHILRGISR